MTKAAWERDAERFGRQFKFGEWESALLVARSVEAGHQDRARPPARGRVISSKFAAVAGVSKSTVNSYMKTWGAAAEAGLVPTPNELNPGQDVELPDPGLWKSYYRKANKSEVQEAAETPLLADRWERWFNHLGNLMLDGARLAEETDDTAEQLDGYAAVARLFYDRLRERQIDSEWRQFSESFATES
jgi:hypothetical protein